MKTFVDRIADRLHQSERELKDWLLIVPSQRASLYLQKSIYQKNGKVILSPTIMTISQFIDEVSPRIILDQTRLLFRLYQVCLQESKDKMTFDEFYNWGKVVLSDFDEIENYLVDGKDIFKNLKDIKQIESWSFNSEELTASQLKFMVFWEELGKYYPQFSKALLENNEVYRGKATREVAENIDWTFKRFPSSRILFAGFNAHSLAELTIIKQLVNMGRAEVMYEADRYYVDKEVCEAHEAGFFINKNIEFLGLNREEQDFGDVLRSKAMNLHLISCAQNTGQVKSAATILSSLTPQEIDETLVLLADENLLVPLLKNLPKSIGQANITIGLSLNNSILKSWFELIFKIQKGLLKRPEAYHKDIFELCYHPFVSELLTESEQNELAKFERGFKYGNVIYILPEKLNLPIKIKAIVELVYSKWSGNWGEAVQRIRKVNAFIYEYLKDKNDFEKSLIETFDRGIVDLVNCLQEGTTEISLSTFKHLFTEHYSRLKISYFGNPLKGLQIMGLLETRMLNFKRIICLGMNEKNMPPNNQINSFIPMDLRAYFKLPTVRDKQGLFAHHFYRLLHQAEDLYITYSDQQEGINSFEKSRYIMQLELELTNVNPAIQIHHLDYTINNEASMLEETSFAKDEINLNLIKAYLQKGASASGIKNFFTCELDFFYKYILKYRDEYKIEEEIDNSTFGTLIHNTLEHLYKDYTNHQLEGEKEKLIAFREEDLKQLQEHSRYQLEKEFGAHFKNQEIFKTGKNRLNLEMANQLMQNYFQYELNKIRQAGGMIYLESLEQELKLAVNDVKIDENSVPFIKGFIDRIEYYDGGFHIVDYKSGKVDFKKDLELSPKKRDIEEIYNTCLSKKYFIQFYFYLYLFYKTYRTYPKSITFIPFVNSKDTVSITNEDELFELLVEKFPEVLQKIIDVILDDTKEIKHKSGSEYCEFC